MKILLPAILIAMIFSGCSKKSDPVATTTPATASATTTATTTASTTTTTTTTKKDTTTPRTPDELIHTLVFIAGFQVVKTSVTNQTLTLVFNENLNMYVTADGLGLSYAVHLFQNVKNSQLNGLDFTTPNSNGVPILNFADDNLNNVQFKTITDTVVNTVPIKKINVNRLFTYTKTFASNQEALARQNVLFATYTDKVTYSAYTYYNNKTYPTDSVTVYMQYKKQ